MGLRGKKPWEPSEAELAKIHLYAGLGSTQAQIATMIGKSVDLLQMNKTAHAAWKKGQADTLAKVAGKLVQKALAGDTASIIFYLKTQGGWREVDRVEHTGNVNVRHTTNIPMHQLSTAALQEIAQLALPSPDAEDASFEEVEDDAPDAS